MKSIRWIPFGLALLVGCLVNYLGDWVLGIRIELFYGLQTFNLIWFIQIFIWPLVVGMSVTLVYGLGGKWLALLPPLIVRSIAYYETKHILGVPEDTYLMPAGWWAFFVILAMEVAMIGGVIGEIVIRRVYGRSSAAEKAARESATQEAKLISGKSSD